MKDECIAQPEEFVALKTAAMELKSDYLSDPEPENMDSFLNMFATGNNWLSEHYSGLAVDTFSQESRKSTLIL